MSAFDERRNADMAKIQTLAQLSRGKIQILSIEGQPPRKISVRLGYKTAPSDRYPAAVQSHTDVVIDLPSRYPFAEPSVTITTPIFHPNVYSSGKACLGNKWLPTQGLELLIVRLVQLITFDKSILNEKSPANNAALSWYRNAIRKSPSAFPTDVSDVPREPARPRQTWRNLKSDETSSSIERVARDCPHCAMTVRLPKGRTGTVNCPRCRGVFEAST